MSDTYPPPIARPADITREDGTVLRFDYHCSYKRELWQIWRGTRFGGYAVRWPSLNFTAVPVGYNDPEIYLAEVTKEPTP